MSAVVYLALAVSLFFLAVGIAAAVQTRVTGRFASGIHVVPTLFALPLFFSEKVLLFLLIAFVDFGLLFTARRRVPRT